MNNSESNICSFVIWHLEHITFFSSQINLYSYRYTRFCSYLEWLPRRKCSLYFSLFHQLENHNLLEILCLSLVGSRNKLNFPQWLERKIFFSIVFVSLLYTASFNSLFLYSPLTNFLCSLWNNLIQTKNDIFNIMETGLKMYKPAGDLSLAWEYFLLIQKDSV